MFNAEISFLLTVSYHGWEDGRKGVEGYYSHHLKMKHPIYYSYLLLQIL